VRRHAVLGAITGAIGGCIAIGLLGSSQADWAFFYLLSGSWGLADVMHDFGGTPEWLFYPGAVVYFAAVGCTATFAVGRPRRVARAIGVPTAIMVVHIGLAIVGTQRWAQEFQAAMKHFCPLPAAAIPKDIFPASSPTPAR
jgi:hypothetical protein